MWDFSYSTQESFFSVVTVIELSCKEFKVSDPRIVGVCRALLSLQRKHRPSGLGGVDPR